MHNGMLQQEKGKPKQFIPPFIHCPKCGEQIQIRLITDPFKIQQLINSGYDEGGIGLCKCGVHVVIFHQPLPAHPSFYILVDVYSLSPEGG
jgi:hypothetical protein